MRLNFLIRKADENDYDVVYSLLVSYLGTNYADKDLNHPANQSEIIIEASKLEGCPTSCWLAIIGDQAVGIITTKDLNGLIYVEKEYRGNGIGSALLEERNQFMKRLGRNFVDAHIKATDTSSLSFHRKQGYCFDEKSMTLLEELVRTGQSITDLALNQPPVLVMTKRI